MKLKKIAIYLIIFITFWIGRLEAFNPYTHMWLGLRPETIDMWRQYDPSFANALEGCYEGTGWDRVENNLTRKFYLIGLTLPDILDTTNQRQIQKLLITIHNIDDNEYSGAINFGNVLYISDEDSSVISEIIEFPDGVKDLNHNLNQLKRMADYARAQGWSPYEKALIYGAYLHVVQDLYGHMVTQPSFFGYDYAIEGDSAISADIGHYYEGMYEIFTPTAIDDWSFLNLLYNTSNITFSPNVYIPEADLATKDLLQVLEEHERESDISIFPGENIPYDLTFNIETRNVTGGVTTHHLRCFQSLVFLPIRRFIEASNAIGYNMRNLTYQRLMLFIRGNLIMGSFIGGYDSTSHEFGGILSHLNTWNFHDILTFERDKALPYIYLLGVNAQSLLINKFVQVAVGFVITYGILNIYNFFPKFNGITELGIYKLGKLFLQKFHTLSEYTNTFNTLIQNLSHPLPYYFQDSLHLAEFKNHLFNALNDIGQNTDSLEPLFVTISNVIEHYHCYGRFYHVNDPLSYRHEPWRIKNIIPLMASTVVSGQMDLNYDLPRPDYPDSGYSVYALSRKAGVLGGLYPINDTTYYHQPGVIDMHFEKDGRYVYTEQEVPFESDNGGISLAYDVVTFGGTRIHISNAHEDPIKYIGSQVEISTVDRVKGHYTIDYNTLSDSLFSIGDTTSQELAFVVMTFDTIHHTYGVMLNSNYRGAFNRPEVANNIYYETLFVNGTPTREKPEPVIQS